MGNKRFVRTVTGCCVGLAVGATLLQCGSDSKTQTPDDAADAADVTSGGSGGDGTGGAATTGGQGTGATGSGGSSGGGGSTAGGSGSTAGGSGSGGVSAGGSEGGSTDCVCASDVPADWLGPVVVSLTNQDAGGCPTGFDSVGVFHSGATGAPATCDCACDDPKNPFCDAYTIVNTGASCGTTGTNTFLVWGECVTLSGTGVRTLKAPTYTSLGGGCDPIPTTVVPDPSGDTSALFCNLVNAECGGNANCVASTSEALGSACIHRDGDVACPTDGPFTHRSIWYGDYDDTRGCSECTCGDATGTCTGTVTFRSGTCGLGTVLDTASVGECTTSITPVSATLGVYAAPGSCPPSSVEPIGDLSPVGPHTACCTESL